jgi:hypothetical protein
MNLSCLRGLLCGHINFRVQTKIIYIHNHLNIGKSEHDCGNSPIHFMRSVHIINISYSKYAMCFGPSDSSHSHRYFHFHTSNFSHCHLGFPPCIRDVTSYQHSCSVKDSTSSWVQNKSSRQTATIGTAIFMEQQGINCNFLCLSSRTAAIFTLTGHHAMSLAHSSPTSERAQWSHFQRLEYPLPSHVTIYPKG